jgi:FkbM family methyltransferase
MISYAQNFEDVMLARALGDVGVGSYVDVGAADPIADSVTAHFYELGWSGVNIEPLPAKAAALRRSRPRDITLAAAVGDVEGEGVIKEYSVPGWATLDRDVMKFCSERADEVSAQKVSILTLNQVFETYAGNPVHLLKVDCEGYERKALLGINLRVHRPWIIVIEAIYPHSEKDSSHEWSDILDEAGYRFVYFDGINRFYLAAEQLRLTEHFKSPPNTFDQFELARETQARGAHKIKIDELEMKIERLERLLSMGCDYERDDAPAGDVGDLMSKDAFVKEIGLVVNRLTRTIKDAKIGS